MAYSRNNPSPRYEQLLNLYRSLHEAGADDVGCTSQDTFPGYGLLQHLEKINYLVSRTGSTTILDYGSGKGQQYQEKIIQVGHDSNPLSIAEFWDVDPVHCYDPAYPKFSQLPVSKFDGVISTDMLEHCPEEDVAWVLNEMFSFAKRFVYLNIASYAAKKSLPNGENAHCTVKPPIWWRDVLQMTAENYPNVLWEAWVTEITYPAEKAKVINNRLGNFPLPETITHRRGPIEFRGSAARDSIDN